jgi:2,6-dihydroxypyridine 3-monooxygenase
MAAGTAWPRVAVMGGSLGGLTAALVLRDLGCDVHIFERSASPLEERGAGIVVLDVTVRYLVERDVVDLADICTYTNWVRYLDRDGSVRYEERRRYRFSSWNRIYRTLMDCLGGNRYHLDHEIVEFEPGGQDVRVRFADGTSSDWDMVVCADGVASTARRLLLGDIDPRYAGYVAWRGTLGEGSLSPNAFDALDDAITYQLLADSHILVYPIPGRAGEVEPGRRLTNFVWYRNVAEGDELSDLMTDRSGARHTGSLPPGAVQDRHRDEMVATATAELAPVIAEVVERTEQPFIQVVFDVEVPAMAFGRIALMGDGAFAARPHAAAGTAKAAANAWALAESLEASGGDVEKALQMWEPGQLELGRNLVARARDIGNRSQFEGTWTPGDPSLVFGLYGPGR